MYEGKPTNNKTMRIRMSDFWNKCRGSVSKRFFPAVIYCRTGSASHASYTNAPPLPSMLSQLLITSMRCLLRKNILCFNSRVNSVKLTDHILTLFIAGASWCIQPVFSYPGAICSPSSICSITMSCKKRYQVSKAYENVY